MTKKAVESAVRDSESGNNEKLNTDTDDEDINSMPVSEEKAMSSRLNNAINQSIQTPTNSGPPNMSKIIKQELAHFECTNELGHYLKKLLICLESIQPTSTESERAFSK